MFRRSFFNAAGLVALFVAALIANQRLAGTSPIVWVDTFNDEHEVRRCVLDDSCTLVGVQTAIRGLFAAVGWLELRTLLAWLGVGLDGVHLVVQLLNGLAVVLVFHLAAQLGGPLAGAAAAWLFMDRIEALVRIAALHNSSILLFLGAAFVLACTAVVLRPGALSVALAALVGAVMANVHLACVLTGASVVLVALTAPRRRLLLAVGGGALFALATVAMAPPTWLQNIIALLQPRGASPRHPAAAMILPSTAMLGWSLFAVCAWVASLASRAPAWVEYRRRSLGALAVVVPLLVALLVAPLLEVSFETKYLFHAKAACAVAAALPLAMVAGAMLRALSPRWLLLPIERVAPFAVALLMVLPGPLGVSPGGAMAEDERTPTIGDLAAVVRILSDEHGWDAARMLERLKTPYGVAVLGGLRQLTVAVDGSRPGMPDDGRGALLLVLGADDLPHPLPVNWRIVSRGSRSITVLIVVPSRIDWSRFEVCIRSSVGAQAQCAERSWGFDEATGSFVPDMPPAGEGWRGVLEMSLPLRPALPGSTHEIFMPRLPFVCGGRVASPSGGAVDVNADGRRAVVAGGSEVGAGSPATITLEWQVGSRECDPLAYEGVPPFFVEGDTETVRRLEAVWRKREH